VHLPTDGARGSGPPEHFVRPAGTPPVNGYSHAVAFGGRMVVVSGQVPVDAAGRLVGKDDPAAQITQVFENLADLGEFRRARDRYVSAERPPASSLVQVSALVNPDFRVEVEALAAT
jgi:enamine deaminase RidA (YjgF/YER057c/UK114 family)